MHTGVNCATKNYGLVNMNILMMILSLWIIRSPQYRNNKENMPILHSIVDKLHILCNYSNSDL